MIRDCENGDIASEFLHNIENGRGGATTKCFFIKSMPVIVFVIN